MQKMGWARNAVAAAAIAFRFVFPMAEGCAPSPRTPVSEACISPNATLGEARERVETAIERIDELQGILLDRMRKVEEEIAGLGSRAASRRQSLRYVLDVYVPSARNTLLQYPRTLDMLREKMGGAEGNAERMRMAAQIACASREVAEITFESGMSLLGMVSVEIRAAGKE